MAFGKVKAIAQAQPVTPRKVAQEPAQSAPDSAEQAADKDLEYFYQTKENIRLSLVEVLDIKSLNALQNDEARREISSLARKIIERGTDRVPAAMQSRIINAIVDDILGYGPLEELLAVDEISDIMVNGAKKVFIEINGKVRRANVQFKDNQHLMNVCQRIVSQVGRRVDESSPICDARLPDGSRVNVIAPPLAIDGPALTIRKFRKEKLTLDNLVAFGSISPEGAEILRILSRCRCNVIVSGGTGSGKTTLLNCLTAHIDHDERIVTCEDAAELQLQQTHVVRLETRPPNLEGEGEVRMRDLVKNCLRMRPDRIVVGEVRGAEAFDLLQAMNTGHDGSMGTVHANSPRDALRRLETMVTGAGYALPVRNIREMIASSIEIIIQTSRLRDGRRVITHITEVIGMEEEVIRTQDLLVYKITAEDGAGHILGAHSGTGISVPHLWDRAVYFGEGQRLATAIEAANEHQAILT